MKKIVFFITLALSFIYKINAQAYVKFAKEPAMELKAAKQFHNYRIAYKAIAKSTVYLELKQGDKLVANGVYDIIKPGEKTIVLNINVFKNIESLKEGNNYSYTLYMYEGQRNDFSQKACKTIIKSGVSVIQRKNKKSVTLNTLH